MNNGPQMLSVTVGRQPHGRAGAPLAVGAPSSPVSLSIPTPAVVVVPNSNCGAPGSPPVYSAAVSSLAAAASRQANRGSPPRANPPSVGLHIKLPTAPPPTLFQAPAVGSATPLGMSSDTFNKEQRICRHYMKGKCTWGATCRFIHPRCSTPPHSCSELSTDLPSTQPFNSSSTSSTQSHVSQPHVSQQHRVVIRDELDNLQPLENGASAVNATPEAELERVDPALMKEDAIGSPTKSPNFSHNPYQRTATVKTPKSEMDLRKYAASPL